MKNYRRKLRKISKPLYSAGHLLLFPVALYILFFFVFQIHLSLQNEINRYDISSFSENAPVSPYPVLIYPATPLISAQAAVIMDDDSKVFIYEKNPDIRFSMASTTKLMTALVSLETYSVTDSLMVYDEHVEGSAVGLRKGERYTLESLLYALLLPSANDAAVTIADNYPGGEYAFVARMNEKAKELQLLDTQYDDPAGLEDDGNYTTAADLAHLASYAMQNKTIAMITGTKLKTIRDLSNAHTIPLENLNILLGSNGIVGIKTGYTQGAGGVLTTARKMDGHTQILVVMKSQDRFGDTSSLLSLITGNITYVKPVYSPVSMMQSLIISR